MKNTRINAVRFLTMFKQAIRPAIITQPTKRPYDFSPLATVAFFPPIFRRSTQWLRYMIIVTGRNRNKSALAPGAAMRFAIATFTQVQAPRPTATAANPDTINRFQQVTFQAFEPVFSGKADLIVRPPLDRFDHTGIVIGVVRVDQAFSIGFFRERGENLLPHSTTLVL